MAYRVQYTWGEGLVTYQGFGDFLQELGRQCDMTERDGLSHVAGYKVIPGKLWHVAYQKVFQGWINAETEDEAYEAGQRAYQNGCLTETRSDIWIEEGTDG